MILLVFAVVWLGFWFGFVFTFQGVGTSKLCGEPRSAVDGDKSQPVPGS